MHPNTPECSRIQSVCPRSFQELVVFTGQSQTTVVVKMQSPEHHTRDFNRSGVGLRESAF